MERAADLLGGALRRMQDPSVASVWLHASWPSLIGSTMAAHLRPISCARGILRVDADSREWKKQAESMEQQLRERVNQSWGKTLIREVRIELANDRKRLSYEVDNHHLPFLRNGARPKR